MATANETVDSMTSSFTLRPTVDELRAIQAKSKRLGLTTVAEIRQMIIIAYLNSTEPNSDDQDSIPRYPISVWGEPLKLCFDFYKAWPENFKNACLQLRQDTEERHQKGIEFLTSRNGDLDDQDKLWSASQMRAIKAYAERINREIKAAGIPVNTIPVPRGIPNKQR